MVIRGILATLAFAVLEGGVLFGAAGRWDLPAFWLWLAVMVAGSCAVLPLLARTSPGLIEERLHPGAAGRDPFGVAMGVADLLAMLVLAGLDAGRFRWGPPVPPAAAIAAWVTIVGGFALVAWAMGVNRFFSSAVRIQSDRGQVVVTTGPYALVRHPGYTGGLLFMLGIGPALGSWWAAAPVLPALVWIVRRALLEDAMLRHELAGYADYAARVRFRLLPGVW